MVTSVRMSVRYHSHAWTWFSEPFDPANDNYQSVNYVYVFFIRQLMKIISQMRSISFWYQFRSRMGHTYLLPSYMIQIGQKAVLIIDSSWQRLKIIKKLPLILHQPKGPLITDWPLTLGWPDYTDPLVPSLDWTCSQDQSLTPDLILTCYTCLTPDLAVTWLTCDLKLTWFGIQWVSDPLQVCLPPSLDWLC